MHAQLWHGILQRAFLIDLESTHGTFVGHIQLESGKPQAIPPDAKIHFGASTRIYVLRERMNTQMQHVNTAAGGAGAVDGGDGESGKGSSGGGEGGNFLGLPQSETELDNLTEFHTAHNKRFRMFIQILFLF